MEMNLFEKIARIDAERVDPDIPEAHAVSVSIGQPRTVGGKVYPHTCVVDFERGRWPAWFLPQVQYFRRLQTVECEQCGFVTRGWSCFTTTALVSRDPGSAQIDYRMLKVLVESSGWRITQESTTWTPKGGRRGAVDDSTLGIYAVAVDCP